ncbi:DUF2905 domain-containing protein [Olivibacter sp. SDN3]|nr:DUF2905 domain-containing protein [Olivibacter sp. SDN3]
MAKMMIIGGGMIMLIGVVIYFAGNYFKWFGRLPGDIKIVKPGFNLYAPIVSMLILSGVISLLLWIFRKFF